MNRKYNKDNPMPREEFNRIRRNLQRRIANRKKNQIKPATIKQFEQVLFDALTSKTKDQSDVRNLQKEIEARVKELVFSETGEALRAAAKLKKLFGACGLSKQELIEAIKQSRWAKLHDEILKLEVQKGVDDINAGYYTVIETKADVKNFIEGIKQRGLRKLKRKQKIQNNSVQI